MNIICHSSEQSKASGPYHPAVEVDTGGIRQLHVSGQGTYDPQTGERFLGDITGQARRAMENLKIVVEGSGFRMDQIVKVTLYLVDLGDAPKVNKVYRMYFSADRYPARSIVGVKELPGGQAIEIDALAVAPAQAASAGFSRTL